MDSTDRERTSVDGTIVRRLRASGMLLLAAMKKRKKTSPGPDLTALPTLSLALAARPLRRRPRRLALGPTPILILIQMVARRRRRLPSARPAQHLTQPCSRRNTLPLPVTASCMDPSPTRMMTTAGWC